MLLLDADQRVLLVCARAKENPAGVPHDFCFTPGGELDAGESVLAAAKRELAEETGLTAVEWSRAVWYGEQVLPLFGEPVLFKETFVLGRARETALSDRGWTALERATLVDLRWWSLDALESTREVVYPTRLPAYLRSLLEGGPAPALQAITL